MNMVTRLDDEPQETPDSDKLTAGSLQAWLIQQLAASLNCRPEEIDPRTPFTALGVDSLRAFNLTGELAQWLQQELPVTLLWEHSTVEQLVQHLEPTSRAVDG
jgi:acyl carrier protein